MVKFIKGITKRGETPQKILAHPVSVSQEEVEATNFLRRKAELMDDWTEKVLEHAKASLKVVIDRYTTWGKLIRRIDRTQKAHEEFLEHVKVEMSYFQMAEEITTEELLTNIY